VAEPPPERIAGRRAAIDAEIVDLQRELTTLTNRLDDGTASRAAWVAIRLRALHGVRRILAEPDHGEHT
jgi:hypothetical protein